jgi:DNA-binding transcriptional ArsR family regulator
MFKSAYDAGMPSRSTSAALPERLLEQAARRFRALAVPSRLRILNALMDGPLGLSELERVTALEQSNLSRQVTELERAGCVVRRRTGRTVEVELDDPSLRPLCELVCGALVARAGERRR